MKDVDTILENRIPGKYTVPLKVITQDEELEIPMLFLIGDSPGPTNLVNGGTHGDEFEGPEAIRRFWHSVTPERVRGSIVLIPVLNLPAYLAAARNNPRDGVDMSGAWGDHVPDSPTSRIVNELKRRVLQHAAARLDMHGGGDIFNIARLVMFTRPPDETLEARYAEIARQVGIELVWRFPTSNEGGNYFARNDKVSIGVEIGGEARLRESAVRDSLAALQNFLVAVGNLQGTPVLPRQWHTIEGRPDHSIKGGFLRPFVELGDRVIQGQRIGLITDLVGKTVEEVVAVQDGIVTTVRTKPVLPPGGATFQVSKVVETIPNAYYEERK